MRLLQKISIVWLLAFCFASCENTKIEQSANHQQQGVQPLVLGTIQDAGSPHIGCKKDCCKDLFIKDNRERKVVALGLIDSFENKRCLIEASPDIAVQLKELSNGCDSEIPDAIFLSHAHIGHYSGLMYLGREAMNAKNVKVFVMPRMNYFLKNNGPWNQLLNLNNIALHDLKHDSSIHISKQISITTFTVPHRDEYSETVGYLIKGPNKKALFIPDIDKWEKWSRSIGSLIKQVDFAFIDGTFYDGKELEGRNMSEIPHPFIVETMERFKHLSESEKRKIFFIHLNHTNPALNKNSEEYNTIQEKGFRVAELHQVFHL